MSGRVGRRRHGGDVWRFSREHNVPVEEIIDFSAPINPFGAPPKAIEALRRSPEIIRFYPDRNPLKLKESIASYIGDIAAENVALGNGSVELIYAFVEIFAKNHRALILVPSFTEYEAATIKSFSDTVHVKMNEDFSINVDAVKAALNKDVKVLILCNPHSPSGRIFEKETMLDLIEACHDRDIQVLVDENYMDFVEQRRNYSVSRYVHEYDNLLVLGSFSKFFGMPGIRIGYGMGNPELINVIEDHLIPWNVNALSIIAAAAALEDWEFIENTRRYIRLERERLEGMLKQIRGLKVYPSSTNFLLLKILDEEITARQLQEKLAEENMLIRNCEDFHGLNDKYFRISVRSVEENNRLVEALKKVFQKS